MASGQPCLALEYVCVASFKVSTPTPCMIRVCGRHDPSFLPAGIEYLQYASMCFVAVPGPLRLRGLSWNGMDGISLPPHALQATSQPHSHMLGGHKRYHAHRSSYS